MGQPEIKPVVVGVQSNVTLTCSTDEMDEGNPPPSYTIWTKVLYFTCMTCYKNDYRMQIRIERTVKKNRNKNLNILTASFNLKI